MCFIMLDDGMACQQQSKLTFLEGGEVAAFATLKNIAYNHNVINQRNGEYFIFV